MISNRLKSLVQYIDKKDNVIDVGCDHALLDIYLIKNNCLNNIIVADVNKNALQSGINNIKKEKLEELIDTRLGNGLEVLTKNDNIDTLLISGMGTSTILNILDNKYRSKLKKLIIQSNNDHYLLRKNVCKMGYIIQNESYIYDNNKYYINIVFVKGEKNYTEKDYKYGTYLDEKAKEYYNHLKYKYLNILKEIPKNSSSKKRIINIIKEIEDLKYKND